MDDDIKVLTVETKIFLGDVPVIEQSTPTVTDPRKVIDCLEASNIVAIKNHGVVAIGENFTKAFYLIESLEEAVRIAGVARLFQKEDLNVFEQELKHTLSKPLSTAVHKMFSPGHIQAIVALVNDDEFIAQKGAELDLTVELLFIVLIAGLHEVKLLYILCAFKCLAKAIKSMRLAGRPISQNDVQAS